MSILDISRDIPQDVRARVIGLSREPRRVGAAARPAVVEVEGRAMVDEPRVAVPDKEVRVAPRPVDVRGERVQPQDRRGGLGVGRSRTVVPERPRQEVDPEVEPEARGEQVLHLLVRLVLGDRRLEIDDGHPRDVEPEGPGQLADDDLGDQDLETLAGSAELQDVGAEVVGLHDPGQGPALAQGSDVPRRGDLVEHGAQPRGGRRARVAGAAGVGSGVADRERLGLQRAALRLRPVAGLAVDGVDQRCGR